MRPGGVTSSPGRFSSGCRRLTLILSNGAIVKRHGQAGSETLMRRLLPRQAARAALGRAPGHRASAALIFDRPLAGQVVFESIDWNDPRHQRFYEANRPFVSEQSPLEDALSRKPGADHVHGLLPADATVLRQSARGRYRGG